MFTMSDVDEKYFDIKEKEIVLENEYFEAILDLVEGHSDVIIKQDEISGITFWDIMPDTSNIVDYEDSMYDDIDFSSDDDNTTNMWYCVRDYADNPIEYNLRESEAVELNNKLLAKLKELSEGDFDSRIKVLRKVK